jgi:predicted metalloprotease with PDZ domain
MKKICKLHFIALLLISLAGKTYAQAGQNSVYRWSIDLSKVTDDKLQVELLAPALKQNIVFFRLPVMIPGTYAIYDFGRFVSGVKAFDSSGNELKIEKADVNTWKIYDALKLSRLTYTADDTYDADTNNFVFEPAGTNFETGKNYVLNPGSFIGYFEGYSKLPYEISITHPPGFYGSTSLIPLQSDKLMDTYRVESYADLVDAPLMYNLPDTTSLDIGGARILVSVYSDGPKISPTIAAEVKDILVAAKNYLGGDLPIKKYAFLIYLLNKNDTTHTQFGALEHSYSSMYFLPDGDATELASSIRNISAHEFYHIITPLNIHSEEIGNFDFNQPRMSKHLWLYEGVTEYTATYVQLREKLITPEKYFAALRSKIYTSRKNYNDSLPFTLLSKGALEEYKDQYGNVYEKGALIGFCLDVQLRSLSDGSSGLQDLMNQLAEKYGKNKSFRDGTLFREITALTYHQIGKFFTDHVEGSKPLPLEEVFRLIGYKYISEESRRDFSLGMSSYASFNGREIMIFKTDEMGKLLGLMPGDLIQSINGKDMRGGERTETHNRFGKHYRDWHSTVKEGDKLKVKVKRNGKKKTLKARAVKIDIVTYDQIKPDPDATPRQLRIRDAWLGND